MGAILPRDTHFYVEGSAKVHHSVRVSKRVMPDILYALLAEEKIDKDRVGDRDYVWSVIMENLDIIEDFEAIHLIDDEFIASARDAAESGRMFVTLVLIAIAVEHNLNDFYRCVLEHKCHMSRDEATQAIRRNDAESKIGWFYSLVSGRELPEELIMRIRQVHQWRNSLVHYKVVPCHINDKTSGSNRILHEVREVEVEKILKLPMDVEKELTKVKLELIPLLEESENIAKALFSE